MMPGKKDYVSVGKKVHVQKRLILCNLKELYAAFKEVHSDVVIGFSKFCSLRPKWCVTVDGSGSHSVCVCVTHQNVLLMLEAVATNKTNKDMIDMIVCSKDNKQCMVHRCDNCPRTSILKRYLDQCLHDGYNDGDVIFQQWENTGRSELVKRCMSIDDFVELLVKRIDALTSHSFLAKCQSKYLNKRKEELEDDYLLILAEFAENYAFFTQDEIQSAHWNKQSCTLHPIAMYFKKDNQLAHLSFCFISDDLDHDTCFVYELQTKLLEWVKFNLPHIKCIEYFSDGCAAQYKNFKNMMNLCLHFQDFYLRATWNFFASSHGKSVCDGIGGTVKRLTARASLQSTHSNQILTVSAMLKFCKENIKDIEFFFISKDSMVKVREQQIKRFAHGSTIPGTRSFHQFVPLSDKKIALKYTSDDRDFAGTFSFASNTPENGVGARRNEYVACIYDHKWWVGMILEINEDEGDFQINLMHPPGPTQSFTWPSRPDICWVSSLHMLCKIDSPKTVTGRTYNISYSDYKTISKLFLG